MNRNDALSGLERRQKWDHSLRAGAVEIFRQHLQHVAAAMVSELEPLAADAWLWVEETFWCRGAQEGISRASYEGVARTVEHFAAKSVRDCMLRHLFDVVPLLELQVRDLALSTSDDDNAPANFAFEQALCEICRQLALIILRLRSLSGERRARIYPADPFVLMHSAPDPLSMISREQANVRSEWAGAMGLGDCWGHAHVDSLQGTPQLASTVGGKIDKSAAFLSQRVGVAKLLIAEKQSGCISADLRSRMALMTASQLAEEFIGASPRVCMRSAGDERESGKSWCDKTRQQFRSAARLATKFFGIRPFVQIDHGGMVVLYKKLLQLPVNHHTHLADEKRTIDEIIVRGETEGAARMAPQTATRHINNLRLLYAWLSTAFVLPAIKWEDIVTWAGSGRVVGEILPTDQIIKFFHLPIWTGAANFRGTPKKGRDIWHSAFYFVPLLLWYTGITRDALCAALLDDITEIEGRPCIRAQMVGIRGFDRFVPIHSELLRLGFLDYVAALREEGETRLFPELSRAGGQSAADVFSSRCWRPIRTALPWLPIDCAAGAIRDAAERALADAGAFEEKVQDLFGTRGTSEADLRYTRITPPSHLIAIVEMIPVTTSHIERWPIRLLPPRARQMTSARTVPQVQQRIYQEQALRALLLPHPAANKNDPMQPPTEVA